MDMILVLTNSRDGEHTDSVISHLNQNGEKVFRFNVDKLASGDVAVVFRNNFLSGSWFMIESPDGAKCESCDIKSVWYRQPNYFNLEIRDNIQKQFAEEELQTFLEGLYLSLPSEIFWLNHPLALARARKKTVQIQLAQSLGLNVPNTIIANNAEIVRRFVDECRPRRVVFKTFGHNLFDYGNRSLVVPTTILTEDHLSKLDLIRATPSIFQEFIEKEYDVRVTIVGDEIFAVRIDSQEFQETAIDWRRAESVKKLKHSVIELPGVIAEQCKGMMSLLGISFAAFDFVVSRNGNIWYFLEVNPNGQWFWLEHLTRISISRAIAVLLSIAKERR